MQTSPGRHLVIGYWPHIPIVEDISSSELRRPSFHLLKNGRCLSQEDRMNLPNRTSNSRREVHYCELQREGSSSLVCVLRSSFVFDCREVSRSQIQPEYSLKKCQWQPLQTIGQIPRKLWSLPRAHTIDWRRRYSRRPAYIYRIPWQMIESFRRHQVKPIRSLLLYPNSTGILTRQFQILYVPRWPDRGRDASRPKCSL
jgi:hypothetical protein